MGPLLEAAYKISEPLDLRLVVSEKSVTKFVPLTLWEKKMTKS